MSTPLLSTYVKGRVIEREQQMQTAFPAKVLSYSASNGTVKLEPQFIETWVTREGIRKRETTDRAEWANIENVPVCFPHFMSWDIPVNSFGLVICTKYSLDKWRQQLTRIDPGDLRRFGMSGATFHPVVIGRSPSVAQDFVALSTKIDAVFDALINAVISPQDGGKAIQDQVKLAWSAADTVASSKVKAEV